MIAQASRTYSCVIFDFFAMLSFQLGQEIDIGKHAVKHILWQFAQWFQDNATFSHAYIKLGASVQIQRTSDISGNDKLALRRQFDNHDLPPEIESRHLSYSTKQIVR